MLQLEQEMSCRVPVRMWTHDTEGGTCGSHESSPVCKAGKS